MTHAESDGSILLRNCPFAALTTELDSVVCWMTFQLVDGILEELSPDARLHVEPKKGFCCVVVDTLGDGQPPKPMSQ